MERIAKWYGWFARWTTDRKTFVCVAMWLSVYALGLALPSEPYRNLLVESSFDVIRADDPDGVIAKQIAIATTQRSSGSSGITAATPVVPQRNLGMTRLTPRWFAILFVPLLVLVVLSYTPSNLALLCVFGALLGADVYRKVYVQRIRERTKDRKAADIANQPAGAPPAVVAGNVTAPKELADPSDIVLPISDGQAVVHGLAVYLALYAGLIVVQGSVTFDSKAPDLYLRVSAFSTLFAILAGANPRFLEQIKLVFNPLSAASKTA